MTRGGMEGRIEDILVGGGGRNEDAKGRSESIHRRGTTLRGCQVLVGEGGARRCALDDAMRMDARRKRGMDDHDSRTSTRSGRW